MKAILVTTIVLLFNTATQLCAETNTTTPLLQNNSDIVANSFRVIWGLLIVLGVILLLYGLLRKRFSLLSSLPDKEINVIEIKPLMGKKALCLVEVRGTEYLLGVSESHISNIATLPPKNGKSFSETLNAESGKENE